MNSLLRKKKENSLESYGGEILRKSYFNNFSRFKNCECLFLNFKPIYENETPLFSYSLLAIYFHFY